MKQLLQNQQNPQNKRKKLINFIVVILAILIVFTACHKKKKPFLLLPLIDNSSVASSPSGPTFTPAIGVLDTSFNSPNGYIIQPIDSDNYGQSLAIQPDGKILLGGYCINGSDWDFCIARFEINGSPDPSFGTGGKVIQSISTGSSNDYGQSLAIQSDGKILLGGYCDNGSNYDFCIARFNPNGSLDPSFGTGGKVIQPIGSSDDYAYSLAIQPDGKILLGGFCINVSNYDFCIARFN
jgi:uncharacterized delta-60 repeat protein